jgi:hypothetical protein
VEKIFLAHLESSADFSVVRSIPYSLHRLSHPGSHSVDIRNKKLWEELIAYFPRIRHGPHRKRRVQDFFCCFVCIRCRFSFRTESLPSNDRGVHIQTHRLMGRIYKVRRRDGLKCHDIQSLIKTGLGIHKLIWGDTQTHRQHGDRISILSIS